MRNNVFERFSQNQRFFILVFLLVFHLKFFSFYSFIEKINIKAFEFERFCSCFSEVLIKVLFFLPQSHKDLHFVHVRQGGLYWVATTTADSSPFVIIEFLNRLVPVPVPSRSVYGSEQTGLKHCVFQADGSGQRLLRQHLGEVAPDELRSDLRAAGRGSGEDSVDQNPKAGLFTGLMSSGLQSCRV